MKKTLPLILLLCALQVGRAQTPVPHEISILCDTPSLMTPSQNHPWQWGLDLTTFFRDAEFSSPYTRGYTATGFFLTPFVSHPIAEGSSITLGVNLNGVAGYSGIHSWHPFVRLQSQVSPHLLMVMGSLYSALSHGLYEPMFDRERYIYDHQEQGVQFLLQLPIYACTLFSDTWVYWEDLLEPWQPKQERFTLGTSNLLTFPEIGRAQLTFSIPFSFLGSHRGGQFTALDTCIESLFNESLSLRVSCMPSHRSRLTLDLPCFLYQDISPQHKQHFSQGTGFWPHITFRLNSANKNTTLILQGGYWHGHQYIAPRGSHLFQSVSWHRADFTDPIRSMATAKLAFQKNFNPNFALGLDAECYYHIPLSQLDMAFGLYMRYHI